MRNRAAHALRWLARQAIATSNRLDPIREATEDDWAEWVGCTGVDGTTWNISGPPHLREEC